MPGDVNDAWYLRVNDFARSTGWLHTPMADYARYGVVLFGVLLVLGWWVARSRDDRRMAAALLAPASTLLAVALNQPIVKRVHEARPYALHPHALVLVSRSSDPSFPSDHATMAGAVTVGLFLVAWELGLAAAVSGVVLAAARVYSGVHYPLDVVAGLALGAAVSLVVWLLLHRLVTRLVAGLRRSRLRPLVA